MSTTARKIDEDTSPRSIRPSAIDVFRERCEARAILVEACLFDWHDAVDGLQADAVRTGLVDEIGQDAVQAMMAQAFAIVPKISGKGGNATLLKADATTSILRTAELLIQQNDPARLKAWLATCSSAECEAILQHIERMKS